MYLRLLFYYIAQNKLIYRISQRLVFDFRGENNCAIETNGEMSALTKYLNEKSPVIFDVGANLGDWTKIVLQINPSSQIHAFEPSKKTFAMLAANNFAENVRLNNFGLGSESGQREFFSAGDDSTVSSLYNRGEIINSDTLEKEIVNLETVDEYCLNNNIESINFLKIDVEGNELEVLRGGEQLLKSGRIAVMQIEYGGTYIDAGILLRDVFDYINNCGSYRFYKILFNRLEEVTYVKDLENFQYSNYLVVKK